MIQLSVAKREIHNRALYICKRYFNAESELVLVLIEVDRSKLYRDLGKRSLFVYAVECLGLSEAVACCFISVARKSAEVPELRAAIVKHKISVSKASRIVSALNKENASELISFASGHTTREIDFEMARRNPKACARDRVKPVSENKIQMTVTLTMEKYAEFMRAEALLAQKGKAGKTGENLVSISRYFVDHEDPVRKADRAMKRKARKVGADEKKSGELCLNRVPLTAAQKHEVFARDRGRCTHVDASGKKCGSDRWVKVHHIRPVSQGGGNEPENLTTLCGFHHGLVHQLSFGIDGQVSYLRERVARYG